MSVPDFQSLMLPAFKALAGGKETSAAEVREHVAAAESLTVDDMREMLPSGRQSVFVNRVSWAVMCLGRAGLAEHVRRGVWRLTAEGERLLADLPSTCITFGSIRPMSPSGLASMRRHRVAIPNLRYRIARRRRRKKSLTTPPGSCARHWRPTSWRGSAQRPPAFLEHVVIDLLRKMGYGLGDPTMGRVTGRSGDGGIDGKITSICC